MTTITLRGTKGSPLTNAEVDNNFENLNTYKVEQTSATGAAALPTGTTAQRPASPVAGNIRYNASTGKFEGYGSAWGNIGGGAAIGDAAPSNPGAGDLWWNSLDGHLYVYYSDVDTSQWVDAFAGGEGQYLPLTGGTVSGLLNVNPGTAMTTSGNAYGEYITNTSLKTYPSTASFVVYPGFAQNIELGTSQTIDTTTPGGFNFVYGISNRLTKSAGSTSDIERLNFTGIQNTFLWTDLNTCKQYLGLNDIFNYQGIDANGRISSSFSTQTIALTAPAGGTQTISNIAANSLSIRNTNANVTYNITSATGWSAPSVSFSGTAGNITATIGSYTAFGINPSWGSSLSGASSSATITNFYGLRLPPPSSATNLTITNRWGVYADDPAAKNLFSGNILANSGISFPATQNPSSDANTLDDYEEGTWTPLYSTVGGDYTGISYNTASGNYVKIGKQVTVQGQLVTNGAFSGGSGQTVIKGLPFTVANGATGVIWVSPDTANYTSPTALPTIVQCSGTIIPLSKSGTVNNPVFTELYKSGGNANNMQFSLTYFTS